MGEGILERKEERRKLQKEKRRWKLLEEKFRKKKKLMKKRREEKIRREPKERKKEEKTPCINSNEAANKLTFINHFSFLLFLPFFCLFLSLCLRRGDRKKNGRNVSHSQGNESKKVFLHSQLHSISISSLPFFHYLPF